MARATTRADLISTANEQYGKLTNLIESMTNEEQLAPFNFELTKSMKEAHWKRDKNLRDVLIHLYEWHQLLLDWIESNQKGIVKPFLPEPYNWRTYGDMNVELWQKHQSTSYDSAKEMLCASHKRVMELIESFSNEQLFQAGVLPWSGESVVGAYCVSATASHYDWAMKKIKAHIKACRV